MLSSTLVLFGRTGNYSRAKDYSNEQWCLCVTSKIKESTFNPLTQLPLLLLLNFKILFSLHLFKQGSIANYVVKNVIINEETAGKAHPGSNFNLCIKT